ncbi:hypothetical protein HII13_005337 [Brettanomyces bruxellensis]|uniref:DEBR0S1_25752g1_1 n=1 Tax=Dekkera bruxellensis TaxID=5007 RepID=A0A7D9CVN1_DEKBR|nr:hypothetical protein HII13_005337 [Brettanomyces bruxellensis]VUG16791.1 DEBR0S1_25752g1_1 [Brettanomyces bruxellensis]
MSALFSKINTWNKRFPLITLPPAEPNSDSFIKLITKRLYVLPSDPSANKDQGNIKFKLGVYNLFPFTFDENVLVSVDPLCLSALLILTCKTGSRLPQLRPLISASEKMKADRCIVAMSYSASPDGQLPILVEDEVNKSEQKVKRKFRSTMMINKFIIANISDPTIIMCIKLVDTRLFDFYTSCLLASKNEKLIMRLYSLAGLEEKQKVLFDKLVYPAVIAHLASRFQFNIRNPYIASTFMRNSIESWIKPKYYTCAVKEEYEKCLWEGFHTLRMFEEMYKDRNQKFYFDVDKPSIFDYKLAATIYCISSLSDFIPDFSRVIGKCPLLLAHCNLVMQTVKK